MDTAMPIIPSAPSSVPMPIVATTSRITGMKHKGARSIANIFSGPQNFFQFSMTFLILQLISNMMKMPVISANMQNAKNITAMSHLRV